MQEKNQIYSSPLLSAPSCFGKNILANETIKNQNCKSAEKSRLDLEMIDLIPKISFIRLTTQEEDEEEYEETISMMKLQPKKPAKQLKDILRETEATIQNKIKEVRSTFSAHRFTKLGYMSIFMVFAKSIPAEFFPQIDRYLKSRTYVYKNRIVIDFERLKPETLLIKQSISNLKKKNHSSLKNQSALFKQPEPKLQRFALTEIESTNNNRREITVCS